ncbi:MAG TPA: glycoside hydrolase family 15 protein [Burkholderiaceae bacterium]
MSHTIAITLYPTETKIGAAQLLQLAYIFSVIQIRNENHINACCFLPRLLLEAKKNMSEYGMHYPPIKDYAFISDCNNTALVSRYGSIDWCCMPRPDSDSCFGRLLDWDQGGYCSISPTDQHSEISRRYIPGTMILETHFKNAAGEAKLIDFFAMNGNNSRNARYDLVRIVEGISGEIELCVKIRPRFDYGEIIPRVRENEPGSWTAIGSNKGLVIQSDMALDVIDHQALAATISIQSGKRNRLIVYFDYPELLDHVPAPKNFTEEVDDTFGCTCQWWQGWSGKICAECKEDHHSVRSALVLKGLTFERTGAIIAAPTTSLPEWVGASRNWDYRFSWVRDSVFTVHVLYELGYENEAERFLRFIQRSSAGSAKELQIMYGVDGKRRLTEIEIRWLEGYRQSKPVRIGNFAAKQNQLDIYGEILEIASLWDQSGHPINDEYWSYLSDVINTVCEEWDKPDYGIWEFRGGPANYVHSKAMCWSALDQGIKLAQGKQFSAPIDHWKHTREKIRDAIEKHGVDHDREIFVQSFGSPYLDAALLLLPRIGFVAYDDPCMIRTTDAICHALDRQGLLARYNSPDGLPGSEGSFLPCTFWLVRCLAYQGQPDRAWEYYRRAIGCANDIGLFSEEYDLEHRQMLGNFPQGLTHVSQISAKLALEKAGQAILVRH